MDILLYTIKIRLFNQFINKVWWRILLQFVLFALVFVYAMGFGLMYDGIAEENPEIQKYLLVGLLALIAISTLLRGFFPGYIPRRDPVSKQYPVSSNQRFFTNLASELAATYFVAAAFALIVITLFSDKFSVLHFVVGISVLSGAHFFRRLLQTNIDNRLNRTSSKYTLSLVMAGGAIAALAAGYFMLLQDNNWGLLLSPVFMLLVLLADYFADQCVLAPKEKSFSGNFLGANNLYLSLLLRSKNIRVTLLMAFAFKTLFLGLDAASRVGGGEGFAEKSPIIILIIGPLFLFTYVFNNTWGHFRSLWLTTDRTGAGSWELGKLQCRLLLFPLIIDFLITAIYLFFPNENRVFFIIYYFALLAMALPISIISSVYQPKLILSFKAMRQTSSVLFSFISMGAAGLL
ncbi:MAG: hypothetical protein EOP49_29330, partial [Sphingobacteriales bacterium]